ncbi:MAG TPA: DNA polymerase II [Myxococcota bacterium]|nr:DNA polymerase II [Myxococcota bacterium]
MSHSGFIVHPTYRLRSNRAVVQLFGRLASGEPFLVEDTRFRPYFFTHPESAKLLADERDVEIAPSELVDFAGAPLVRVFAPVPPAVPRLREKLESRGARALEADIRFPYRFLIDRGLRAAVEIHGEPERGAGGLLRFRDPELTQGTGHPKLRVLSLDLETLPDASRVLSAALYGAGADEVHVLSEAPVAGAVHHADERALLRGVAERIRALDPDVITGWNVVEFDLDVLAARARSLEIAFEIGRAPGALAITEDASFTRQKRAEIPGRIVLDGIALVRDAFIALDDFSLETAGRTLLGRGKRIHGSGRARVAEILRLYREDPPGFVAYNREDAVLVLEILEQESLLELAIERSLLCGMQLDRVGASIASFDLLYLPELRRRGRVAPSVNRSERVSAPVSGGAVMDSHPGVFKNVAVFDFKSLYPSLMRTFNLDPLAHAVAQGDDAITAPNGARFSRSEAILPEVLARFAERREWAKQRNDRHADLAIKIMMNAMIGVLGAPSGRFFDPEVANAVTSFGRLMLERTRRGFEAAGARVLYGDTDSIFVHVDESLSAEAAHAEAERLRARVQGELSEAIRAEWAVEPRLELELEYVYERFFQPSIRGGTAGSKKRYAGLREGTLHVVGLEAVRRDWPELGRRLQRGMLERLFRDEPVAPFVKETVADLLAGKLDRELVIRKGLRKGAVDRYTASTPPHVEAARKAGGDVGRVVHYVQTRAGPEPVEPGAELALEPDRAHYVDKVVRPIAQAILSQIGLDFDEVIDAPRQLTLL